MSICPSCGIERILDMTGVCMGCQIEAKERRKQNEKREKGDLERQNTDEASRLPVTTETHIEGVVERLGIVTGQCALGMNIFRDFTAEIRDVVGGRSGAYQRAITEAKDTVIAEMQREAYDLGADAVVAVDIDMSEITGGGGLFGGKGMIAMLATGTAVKLITNSDPETGGTKAITAAPRA